MMLFSDGSVHGGRPDPMVFIHSFGPCCNIEVCFTSWISASSVVAARQMSQWKESVIYCSYYSYDYMPLNRYHSSLVYIYQNHLALIGSSFIHLAMDATTMIKLKGKFILFQEERDHDIVWKPRASRRYDRSVCPGPNPGSLSDEQFKEQTKTYHSSLEAISNALIRVKSSHLPIPESEFPADITNVDSAILDYARFVCIGLGEPGATFLTEDHRQAHVRLLRECIKGHSVTTTISSEAADAILGLANSWVLNPDEQERIRIGDACKDVARKLSAIYQPLALMLHCVSEDYSTMWNALIPRFLKFYAHRQRDVYALLASDIPCPPETIAGTHNPVSNLGVYYLNPTGEKLRDVRFVNKMDVKTKRNYIGKEKDMYDDRPLDACEKKYVSTRGGDCYLFVAHCAFHEKCLGFHIITDGSEGRKDVHKVVYQYLARAPRRIFYDFACSASEYCLNREGGFYKDTQFLHDVSRNRRDEQPA